MVPEVRALLPTARRPDLVCLDLGLLDVDGLTLAESPGPQCCAASTASDDEDTRARVNVLTSRDIGAGSAEDLVDRVAEFILERTQRMAPTPQPVRLEDDVNVLRSRYPQFLAEQRFALSEFFAVAASLRPGARAQYSSPSVRHRGSL